ncbi:transcriptional regulator, MarR family [Ancylobacter novellus DSM 506]|jgi:MarR family transcriptional regulator for hemolysin|uniref:Transcriptional regulator, MarR family n=1 Tax=Ancylobacter novellus (strain ATCC 8093 / DSM 506 / JCM 20403 / CCM 1077 / IAM 12100 / NBRC 12443 / NCIMB 10456) TaxID=639283 RepID=D7A854_ANCN5|nr:MarR family transcriptional regulator [Ancylobacter novellus]ADH90512.1 transcriptional regulator, MarR family [Ancylobacter novellus DSM 506]MDF2619158.1 transcriptional regulator, MarR family [Xanthobacteraceae bacterium]
MNDIETLRRLLTAQLLQAGRQWRRIAEKELEKLGISEACAAPLLWTGRLGGGVRQVTLASYVGIEGPSLVRLLDQLAAADLIVRRDDPTDRRAKTIWLTDEGERLSGRIEELLVDLRGQVLADVGKADLEATLRVLKAFDEASIRAATEEVVP